IAYVPTPASFTSRDTAYGLAALHSELERLLGAHPGERNEELNRSVFRLAQLVGGGQLTRSRLEQDALRFSALLGLDPGEARSTVRSALAGGIRFPRSPRARASVKAVYMDSQPNDLDRFSGTGGSRAGWRKPGKRSQRVAAANATPLALFAKAERPRRRRRRGRRRRPAPVAHLLYGRFHRAVEESVELV